MKDYIIRGATKDLSIRIFASNTTELVGTAREKHMTSPVVTAALGRLLTAGAMMGQMLKGDKDLLTLQIVGDGPISGITVTADSKGHIKGYANQPIIEIPLKPNGKLDVSGAIGAGELIVIRDMGLKEPYVGKINLVSGEIAEDLTYYYAASEQVPSAVGLGVLVDKDYSVKCSGGFIVQLMPEASEEAITMLENNLKKISSITELLEEDNTPEDIVAMLFDGMDYDIMEKNDVAFKCNCNKERVEKVLISLGIKELNDLIEEGEEVELNCHFCNTNYTFTVVEMKEIVSTLG